MSGGDDAFDKRYNLRFANLWEFERTDDGILLVRYKQYDTSVRDQDGFSPPIPEGYGPTLPYAEEVWSTIGRDPENKVVILTGHNGVFVNSNDSRHRQGHWDARLWSTNLHRVPRSLLAFLDIPTITVGAANGPATVHAEYLLLCDQVVAAESATFQDMPHFGRNAVPGDGVNIVWPLLLGWNRGRDFLLSSRTLSAHEAFELGLVKEVVPDDQVLPRCFELAREVLRQDEMTLRMTALVLRQQLKMQVAQYLPHSLAVEGLVFLDQSQRGPR